MNFTPKLKVAGEKQEAVEPVPAPEVKIDIPKKKKKESKDEK